jgi:hypothetical protein
MRKTITAGILLILPTTVLANLVWPALYVETKASSVPIIGLSLVLEYIAIRWLFERGIGQSLLYTIVANAASGIVGLFARPLSGLAWELSLGALVMWAFDWGTFNPIAWFFVPVIGGAINAALELLTLKLIWKERLSSRSFMALWVINWITVGLATIWVVLYTPQM